MKSIQYKWHIALCMISIATIFGCDQIFEDEPLGNAIYIQEAEKGLATKVVVDDQDGASFKFTPRSARLLDDELSIKVEEDAIALAEYNKKTGLNYKVLPKRFYQLSSTQSVIKSRGFQGEPVTVFITPLDETISHNEKYAIPISIKQIVGGGVTLLNSAKTVIVTLDRVLTTSVCELKRGLRIELDPAMEITEGWTMQYGFKVYSTGGANQAILYSSNFGNFYVRLVRNRLQFKGTGSDNPETWGKTTFEANKWYHLTYVYTKKHMKLYVNGVLDNEFVFPEKDSQNWITMGNDSFFGQVRDIRIWSKPLNDLHIMNNLYSVDPNSEGLEFYAPLTEEVGLADVTQNNHVIRHLSDGTETKWIQDVRFPQE